MSGRCRMTRNSSQPDYSLLGDIVTQYVGEQDYSLFFGKVATGSPARQEPPASPLDPGGRRIVRLTHGRSADRSSTIHRFPLCAEGHWRRYLEAAFLVLLR
jgi:hypothetical protein